MKLILDDEQKLLFETAMIFVRDKAPVGRLRTYRDNRDLPGYDPNLWRQLAELGFVGLNVPETYGGSGLGFRELGLLLEAAGSRLLPEPLLSTAVMGVQTLLFGGTDEQKAALLPPIAAGKHLTALAHQEPHTRYERYWGDTQARREGDGYVIDGTKTHVVDGHIADTLIVVARSSGKPGQAKGLSLFLVPRQTAGVNIKRLHQLDGRNTAQIELRNVHVNSAALLGNWDGGAKLLDAILDRATIALAAEMLGAMQAAFDLTLDYIKQRVQFDVPIGSFQALQHRAARMFVNLSLARSAVRAALGAVDDPANKPKKIASMASLAKAKLSATMVQIANEGVQMHGGVGVTDEYDIGLYLKRARAADALLGDAAWHRERWAKLKGY